MANRKPKRDAGMKKMKRATSECQRKTSNTVSVLHCHLKASVTTSVDKSVFKQPQYSVIPIMFSTMAVAKVYRYTDSII